METIMQRELRDILFLKRYISNDILEAYIECAALYSREYWLILHEEYLRRMELEIAII